MGVARSCQNEIDDLYFLITNYRAGKRNYLTKIFPREIQIQNHLVNILIELIKRKVIGNEILINELKMM